MQTFTEVLDRCLTPSHYIQWARELLQSNGFTELNEKENWTKSEKKFFVVRDNREIFAINYADFSSGIITATGCDARCFRAKPRSIYSASGVDLVRIAPYGTTSDWDLWRDRDLKIAGRVLYKDGDKVKNQLYQTEKSVAYIASLAIHMNRGPGATKEYNLETDFNPILELTSSDPQISKDHSSGLVRIIAEAAGTKPENIIDFDCHFVDASNSSVFGIDNSMYMGSRLEALLTAIVALQEFAKSNPTQGLLGFIAYDTTQIYGNTRCGPMSTLLSNTLNRIGAPPEFESNTLIIASTEISTSDSQPGSGVCLKIEPDTATSVQGGPFEMLQNIISKNNLEVNRLTLKKDPNYATGSILALAGYNVVKIGVPVYSGNAPRQTITSYDLSKLYEFYGKVYGSETQE